MADTSCPDCGGGKLARYGKTTANLQKYRCLDEYGTGCSRQFVAGSNHLISASTRETVLRLLAENIPPGVIKKAIPGISLRWIYELRRRI